MRLTPIEIKKYEFKKAMVGGVDPNDVAAFLETVSKQWEGMLDDLERSKRRIESLEADTRRYREVESMLQQTLLQAQQSSNDLLDNAKKEAELILEKARFTASQMTEQAGAAIEKHKEERDRVLQRKLEVLTKLKVFLNAELELVNGFLTSDDLLALRSAPTPVSQPGQPHHSSAASAYVSNPQPSSSPQAVNQSLEVTTAQDRIRLDHFVTAPPPATKKPSVDDILSQLD